MNAIEHSRGVGGSPALKKTLAAAASPVSDVHRAGEPPTPRDRATRPIVIVLCLVLPLFFFRLGDRDLHSSHEGRAAQNAQMVLDENAWGLPRLFDGHIELQKPPLYYWCVAVLGWLRGVDAWAVRLPAALAATLCVVCVTWLGSRRGRPLAGLFAGLMLATMVHFTWLARVGRIDMPLTLAVTVALGCFHLGSVERRRSWYFVAYVAVAVGILLKGPIAPVLVGVVVFGDFVLQLFSSTADESTEKVPKGRQQTQMEALAVVPSGLESTNCRRTQGSRPGLRAVVPSRLFHSYLGSLCWGLPLTFAIAAPWFLWANYQTNNEFGKVFFWYHNVERGLGSEVLASHPLWFYVPRFFGDLAPWSLFLPWALWYNFRQKDADAQRGLVWFVAMFVFLSCMRFKRADYLLPAYPGFAIFLGCTLERLWLQSQRRWLMGGFALLVLGCEVACVGPLLVPRTAGEPTYRELAVEIRKRTSVPVIFFRVEAHALAFHVGRPLDTILEWENLEVWANQVDPVYFVMSPESAATWSAHLRRGQLEEVLRTAGNPERSERALVVMRSIQ